MHNNYWILFWWTLLNQTGIDGKAVYFDGINDDVSILDFNYWPDLSISFRFKVSATGNDIHLRSHGDDGATNSVNVVLDDASKSLKTYINGNQSILNLWSSIYNWVVDWWRHFYTLTLDDNWFVPGKKAAVVYIDGIAQITNSSIDAWTYDPTNNITIGRRSTNQSWTFFKWYIDDARIYFKTLTSQEERSIYSTFAWWEPWAITIRGTGLTFSGGIFWSSTWQLIEQQFSDYFKVDDQKGTNSWYYTTISITDLTWSNGTIPNTSIQFKAWWLTLLEWMPNPRVTLGSGLNNYQTFNWTLTYIKRDTAENYFVKAKYGDTPRIKVDIPAYQETDSYRATITYTLYEN
jgi:hypothetical protein